MPDQVTLNGEPYEFHIQDLPCLIHYEKGAGGSHLSLVLLAQLFAQGYKILFLCAYAQGEEKFLEQIGGAYHKIAFVNLREEFEGAEKSQVVLIDSGNDSLLFDAETLLPDFAQRIIFVKNIETFPKALIKMLMESNNVILSGDLDESDSKILLTQKNFNTLIAFNKPRIPLRIKIPPLPKWAAYFSSKTKTGIIQLKKEE